MPASILLLSVTNSRFMGAMAVSAAEGAGQGGAVVTVKVLRGLYSVAQQEKSEREPLIPEFGRPEDLLEFDGVLLLLRDANDAARAVRFMKQAANLPEYKQFVGKVASAFFVPGSGSIDLEGRRKELAYEMMKLGFLAAELPYRFLADNNLGDTDEQSMAGPSLVQLVAARLHARHIGALTTRIHVDPYFRSELVG
ncbi:hypothetical protein CN155_10415 [Sinorhizobium meliloti]|uniref:hypothetical protein n=1 Tax=Rhizobium meliloti TaxID=382 RepID=UPI000FD81963|nr:hypothetical protein [Sinorhizobium meliloti]MDE3795794.1 hypothetical protein [Sinorhizobium meliloti]RVK58273.1 hypothetical protein CN155_10415 [Sinorhizobium meliloti]